MQHVSGPASVVVLAVLGAAITHQSHWPSQGVLSRQGSAKCPSLRERESTFVENLFCGTTSTGVESRGIWCRARATRLHIQKIDHGMGQFGLADVHLARWAVPVDGPADDVRCFTEVFDLILLAEMCRKMNVQVFVVCGYLKIIDGDGNQDDGLEGTTDVQVSIRFEKGVSAVLEML